MQRPRFTRNENILFRVFKTLAAYFLQLECCGVDGYKDWQRNGTAFEAKYKGKFCGETIDNMNPLVREIMKKVQVDVTILHI